MEYTISHPTVMVNNGDPNSWMSKEEYHKLPWRDGLKTIYDPCPAGWRVPTKDEFNGIPDLLITGFSNAINEFGNPDWPYYKTSTISSYPRAYCCKFGVENYGTNPAMAIRPVKE